MGWSKLDLIKQAFEQIGLASYVFDLAPEQLQSALRALDMMMAAWNARGVRLGYPIPSAALGSNLGDDSGLPDSAYEAVVANLGVRLASTVGKPVSMELKTFAKQAYDTLLSIAAMPPAMQFPNTLPIGAGAKPWRDTNRVFVDPPKDEIDAGTDGVLAFDNGGNDS